MKKRKYKDGGVCYIEKKNNKYILYVGKDKTRVRSFSENDFLEFQKDRLIID